MSAAVKKIFWWIVVLFIVFYLLTDPSGFAQIMRALWDVLVSLFESFISFLNTVTA